jgi:prefoldin subunit 5
MNNCGHCGLPIQDGETGIRHFGFYTAHMESRCTDLLKSRINELEADAKELREKLDRAEVRIYTFEHTIR